MEAARKMGVDYLQGYAIGRPQPLSLRSLSRRVGSGPRARPRAAAAAYHAAALAPADPQSSGTSSSATMLMILISGLMAGPAVSL